MFLTNSMKVGIASRDILKLIERNVEFLTQEENLPALAYMLWKWDRLMHSGRYYEWEDVKQFYPQEGVNTDAEMKEWYTYCDLGANSCDNNPKYEIQDLNYPSNEIEELVYGAWGISVANEDYGSDRYADFYKDELPRVKHYFKRDMTFEDWMTYRNDTDGFGTRELLFFAFGTGISIDSNGYLSYTTSDTPDYLYRGWAHMKDKLPTEVSDEFYEIINRPECHESINNAIEKIIAYERTAFIEKNRSLISDLRIEVNENPDYMVMDIRGIDLLEKSDGEIIDKLIESKEYELSLLTKEEIEAKQKAEKERFYNFLKEHGLLRESGYFSYAPEYSNIRHYKELNECYKPHLIQGAKEFIAQGIPMDDPNQFQIDEYNKMSEMCKNVIIHFGVE